jgi:hypothetical protein
LRPRPALAPGSPGPGALLPREPATPCPVTQVLFALSSSAGQQLAVCPVANLQTEAHHFGIQLCCGAGTRVRAQPVTAGSLRWRRYWRLRPPEAATVRNHTTA